MRSPTRMEGMGTDVQNPEKEREEGEANRSKRRNMRKEEEKKNKYEGRKKQHACLWVW